MLFQQTLEEDLKNLNVRLRYARVALGSSDIRCVTVLLDEVPGECARKPVVLRTTPRPNVRTFPDRHADLVLELFSMKTVDSY